jgi:hypothetical protein
VDSAGNIYTANAGTVTLYQFNSSGTQTLTIAASCATPNLVNPDGIAAGSVNASDIGTDTLYRFPLASAPAPVVVGPRFTG